MRLFALFVFVLLASCTQPFGTASKGGGQGVSAEIAPLSTESISTQTLAPLVADQTAPAAPPPAPIPNAPPANVTPTAVTTPAVFSPASDQERACRDDGGIWGKAGRLNAMACFQQPKDGGTSCSKQSDCTTQCLARSRTCAPVWPIFGCSEVLQGDGRMVTLCLD